MAKVTGSNFFDKLKEYIDHEDTSDEQARALHNTFQRVNNFHNPDGDDDDAKATDDAKADNATGGK